MSNPGFRNFVLWASKNFDMVPVRHRRGKHMVATAGRRRHTLCGRKPDGEGRLEKNERLCKVCSQAVEVAWLMETKQFPRGDGHASSRH